MRCDGGHCGLRSEGAESDRHPPPTAVTLVGPAHQARGSSQPENHCSCVLTSRSFSCVSSPFLSQAVAPLSYSLAFLFMLLCV